MNIHHLLVPLYERIAEDPENCDDGLSRQCVNFVGCGPRPGCKRPCKRCLFWTGYCIDDPEIQIWIKESTINPA